MYVAHADGAGDGQVDKYQDQGHRGQVKEHDPDQQEHIYNEQDHIAVAGRTYDHVGDRAGDLGARHDAGHIEQGFPSPAIGIFKQHGKGLSFQMQEGKCNYYCGNIVQRSTR